MAAERHAQALLSCHVPDVSDVVENGAQRPMGHGGCFVSLAIMGNHSLWNDGLR